jgi:hypothetical protein
MILKVISVAYNRPVQLRMLCDQFIVQTDPRWELSVIYDGPAPPEIKDIMGLYVGSNKIKFYCSEKRNGNYGHPNRRMMLDKLIGDSEDFVLLTNEDNYYAPVFVEKVLTHATRTVGVITYYTVHSHFDYDIHNPVLTEGGIDMGAFIVRFDIAKTVGFHYDHFSADGVYAQECGVLCKSKRMEVLNIPKPLFVHN